MHSDGKWGPLFNSVTIAQFGRFQDCERIVMAACEMGNVKWKELCIMVFPHYSKLLKNKRKMFDECMKLLHEKRWAFRQHRLIVWWQTRVRVGCLNIVGLYIFEKVSFVCVWGGRPYDVNIEGMLTILFAPYASWFHSVVIIWVLWAGMSKA